MIDKIALRVQSPTIPLDRLTQELGLQPTDGVSVGLPVSSRRPDGPTHGASTWICDVDVCVDAFNPAPITTLLEAASTLLNSTDAVVDLVLMVTASPLGFQFDFSSSVLAKLGNLGIGVVIDAYSPD